MDCFLCHERMHRFKPDTHYKIECCVNKKCGQYGKAYDIDKTEPYASLKHVKDYSIPKA